MKKIDIIDYILGYINALAKMNEKTEKPDDGWWSGHKKGFDEALRLVRDELINVMEWEKTE